MNRQRNLFDPDPAPWERDEAQDTAVARVVFPVVPFGPYDYAVPEALRASVEPGRRVRVPLGRANRPVVGYCVAVRSAAEASDVERRAHGLKPVKSVVDAEPLLSPPLLQMTQWMAEHYLCHWGQVLEGVIPAGVRVQAGTRAVALLRVPADVATQLAELKLPRKQAEVLRVLAASPRPLSVSELAAMSQCTTHPIQELQRKGLVCRQVCRVDPRDAEGPAPPREPPPQLSADQQRALAAICEAIHSGRHATVLVHGVTGSGKTEVYIRAIEEVVGFGRHAIVLVPEISLTPQTVSRFRSRFDRVAVLHSHLTPADRSWQWRRIASGRVQVVVGARSAVFAPVPQLGLVVLDEEHDGSFKQQTVPRYHARDVALERARRLGVPVVLGSATPSLESWHRARSGEYRLVELPRRIRDRPLPEVGIIDLRLEHRNRYTRGAISRPLHRAIVQALRERGQVILLLNRRGFSTTIQCPACGVVVKCPHCDLPLTHHRAGELAMCHYCEYRIAAPARCPDCGFEGIRYAGLGTQRLEAEVRARFPEASCLRMDSDTMRKPGSHEQALARFREGQIDVLLGTQMIAKGLDFPNVTLVGVINADLALHFPDFRAAERTFQLVTQVAGRTGRGERGGRVLVQTYSPQHLAIEAASRHDYALFADGELPVRRQYGYPPYARMIRLIARGPDQGLTEQFMDALASRLRSEMAARGAAPRMLGPAPAPIAKLRGRFRFHLLLVGAEDRRVGEAVRAATEGLKVPEGVEWISDVDPLDML